jgi:hypothetical protein
MKTYFKAIGVPIGHTTPHYRIPCAAHLIAYKIFITVNLGEQRPPKKLLKGILYLKISFLSQR